MQSFQSSRSVMSDSSRPHGLQPTRLRNPWDFPGKSTGVGCYFLLQCVKVKSENEVAQLCLTLSNPMDCSLPGFSVHGTFQVRVRLLIFLPAILIPACASSSPAFLMMYSAYKLNKLIFLQLRQEPQGTSDFRLRSQGPCRLGTGESGLVLG